MKTTFLVLLGILCSVFTYAQDWKILKPSDAPKAYGIAAEEFQAFYKAVTGKTLEITTVPDESSNLVVIGSDCVNRFTRDAIEKEIVKSFDLGAESDAYRICSAKQGNRNLLFLAGGNGRATLYSVYDFFERQAGCRYFWDGDIIPKRETIVMDSLDIQESPRFMYRGIRYFAHRSLERFQAEHWGPEQWEREISWLTKKRLNLFMLRIGMDDVFQKAFPDIVPYPPTDGPLPEAIARSFDDRTTAWPLQYRGELRKHVLQYAADRGLMHPEDVGTMTHWYSRTPKAFLDAVNPTFTPQSGGAYMGNPTNAVWDIRDDKNLENYWKLTQAHIDNYGRPELFHTIGIAEREVFADRSKNLEMKLYAYRRILSNLRKNYPNAPMLIASWDFYYPGWSGEEIAKLLTQLNPENTIIFDYTSDLPSKKENTHFENWGVVGKFPWIFGIFHAYEWENELRGYYDAIKERMPIAAKDPMCKGFVYWPENSHSDPFMLEFFTHNAWNPNILTPEELLPGFCGDRYGTEASVMQEAWNAAFPIIKLPDDLPPEYREIATFSKQEITPERIQNYRDRCDKLNPVLNEIPEVLRTLAKVPFGKGNAFVDRDAIDLARTVTGRLFSAELYHYFIAQEEWLEGQISASAVRKAEAKAKAVLLAIRDILALHDDYSMNVAMRRLEAIKPVNPAFEQALKGNAENGYCRTYISELFDYYYIPQFLHYTKQINKSLSAKEKQRPFPSTQEMDMQYIIDAFYDKPLDEMRPLNPRPRTNATYRSILERLAFVVEK